MVGVLGFGEKGGGLRKREDGVIDCEVGMRCFSLGCLLEEVMKIGEILGGVGKFI